MEMDLFLAEFVVMYSGYVGDFIPICNLWNSFVVVICYSLSSYVDLSFSNSFAIAFLNQ